MVNWWHLRRAQRQRRREIGHALRAEFELDKPRGWAAVRALVRGVGELERARMVSRAQALEERSATAPSKPRTTTRH